MQLKFLVSCSDGGIEVDRQGFGYECGRARLGKCLETVRRRLDAADVSFLKCFGKNSSYALGIACHDFGNKRGVKRVRAY